MVVKCGTPHCTRKVLRGADREPRWSTWQKTETASTPYRPPWVSGYRLGAALHTVVVSDWLGNNRHRIGSVHVPIWKRGPEGNALLTRLFRLFEAEQIILFEAGDRDFIFEFKAGS